MYEYVLSPRKEGLHSGQTKPSCFESQLKNWQSKGLPVYELIFARPLFCYTFVFPLFRLFLLFSKKLSKKNVTFIKRARMVIEVQL